MKQMYHDCIVLNQDNSPFLSCFFFKSELILGLGWNAAPIERTKIVRKFKDLFGIPVTELSRACWENFPLECYWDLSFQEDFQTCLVSAKLIISLCGIWFFSFYSLSGILRNMWE